MISVGAIVKVTGLSGNYKIIEGPNQKAEFKLQHGLITFWAKEEKLTFLEFGSKKNPVIKTQAPNFKLRNIRSKNILEIDLHGLVAQVAIEKLELFLDRAILGGAQELKVIHGLGTGKLQKVVHQYLSASPVVTNFKIEISNPGVTRVFLN